MKVIHMANQVKMATIKLWMLWLQLNQ